MNFAYMIIPIGRRAQATQYFIDNAITSEAHLWRNGIPDPPLTTWDNGVELGNESNPSSPTSLMLWGAMEPAQETELSNFSNQVPGAKVYWASDGWDRFSVMHEEDKTEVPRTLETWEI